MLRLTFSIARAWTLKANFERNVCDRGWRIFIGPLRFSAFLDFKANQSEAILRGVVDDMLRTGTGIMRVDPVEIYKAQ